MESFRDTCHNFIVVARALFYLLTRPTIFQTEPPTISVTPREGFLEPFSNSRPFSAEKNKHRVVVWYVSAGGEEGFLAKWGVDL